MNAERLKELVGIPWGRRPPPDEADCVSLAVYAQCVLWGRDVPLSVDLSWTEETLRERSREIEREVLRTCVPAERAEPGCVAVVPAAGYLHLVTFVEAGRILHTTIGGGSRISKFRGEVQAWRVR